MKIKSESSRHVLQYVRNNPGCTTVDICIGAKADIRDKVRSAVSRLEAGRAICVDKSRQPHRYYDLEYYGFEKRITNLREFTIWLSQFNQEKEVPMILNVSDEITNIRVR